MGQSAVGAGLNRMKLLIGVLAACAACVWADSDRFPQEEAQVVPYLLPFFIRPFDGLGNDHDIQSNEFTCKYNKHGASYRGRVSTTRSGFNCQKWALQWPHPHHFGWPRLFPEKTVEEANNFCRNPDYHERTEGPWCYTANPFVEWEYCDIPFCSEPECTTHVQGVAYTGKFTESKHDVPCQRWDVQEPHSHEYNDTADFPDASITDAANFCRNPSSKEEGPWCFTTNADIGWDYCDVPSCPLPATDDGADIVCKLTGAGQTYRGTVNITKDGLECQGWDAQSPHQHSRNKPEMFPDAEIFDAENYCRNPADHPFGPWCYTMDPEIRWDYCEIDDCADVLCVDHFSMYENSHGEGGTPRSEYDYNVDICIQGCSQDAECKAVDYHHGNNAWQDTRCWFHITYQLKESPVEGADMYTRNGCAAPIYECHDSFTVTENYHAEEGLPRDVMTLADCKQACLNEGQLCIAFDWDRTDDPWMGYRCWLHVDVINVVPEQDTNHYPRIRCHQ